MLYRYYVSQTILNQARTDMPVGRVPAAEVGTIVVDQVRILLRYSEIIVRTSCTTGVLPWRWGELRAAEIHIPGATARNSCGAV